VRKPEASVPDSSGGITGPGTDSVLGEFPETPDPLLGTIVADRYRVLGRVGEGGMGVVYEAEHVVLEKRVALKVLNQELAPKRDLRERFLQEARAASRIGHENIVDITDFGSIPSGTVFFAMEFLEGKDLSTTIKIEGPLPWDRAKNIAVQICRALGAAHAKGIIHRDLKPENIFLIDRDGRDDFVKVVDFGIAKVMGLEEGGHKLTKTGMIFGTPDYMSPEQATGQKLDHRVDIYALGVILYEMITGNLPFQADSFMAILTKHMFEDPTPPSRRVADIDIPPEIDALILKALAKKPSERYQSMNDFAERLETTTDQGEAAVKTSGPILLTSPKPTVAMAGSQEDSDATEVVDALPQANARAKMLTWVGLGVLVLLVGAVALLLVTRHKKQTADAGSAQTATQDANGPVGAMVPIASRTDAIPRRSDSDGVVSAMGSVPSRQVHPKKIHIWVKTNPPGADVYLNGMHIGQTPLTRFPVPYGVEKRTVLVKRHRYRSTAIEFVPNADQHWSQRLVRHGASTHSATRQRPVHREKPRARSRTRPRGMDSDLKTPSWTMGPG